MKVIQNNYIFIENKVMIINSKNIVINSKLNKKIQYKNNLIILKLISI
jgi:hypothetical protein